MIWQTILLYTVVALACSLFAVLVIHRRRRFKFDFLAYLIVGLLGAWVAGVLFGQFGVAIYGISVAAIAVGAGVFIEADYRLNCFAEGERGRVAEFPGDEVAPDAAAGVERDKGDEPRVA